MQQGNDVEDNYWTTLISRSEMSASEIKEQVDLVWLVERYGVPLTPNDSGKWMGHCPFHSDSNPSFEVHTYEGEDKVGCWSCDFGKVNDHFDFVSQMHGGLSFPEAKEIVLGYVAEAPDRRRREVVKKTPKVDLNEMSSKGTELVRKDPIALQEFLHDKGMVVETDWLIDQFRVGLTNADRKVIAPHMDRHMTVHGIKKRDEVGFTSIYGSNLDHLYGIWRSRNHERVILVEGETDTWTVAWAMRDEDVDVLGLPSGASSHPKPAWVDYLRDKQVTVLFDADHTGRSAAKKWRELLGVIRYVRLREGEDATSVGQHELLRAISEGSETGQEWPTYLQEAASGAGLMKLNGDDDPKVVANFYLRPQAVTRMEEGEGHVFDVILPDGRRVQITTGDMETDARIRKWANGYGYTWSGTTRDSQELLRWMHHEVMFKPSLSGTQVAGLHEKTFVLPTETIGAPGWRYVPGAMSVLSPDMLAFEEAKRWDTEVPRLLTSLHTPAVATPIVGWCAASFLRPLVSQFPILAVVGGAGLGKTTLVRVITSAFGSKIATTLTATTPHAVTAFLSSTNSIPVWFDEYRLGARDDSKKVFEQSLRDAWEGSASFKGGLKQNLQEVTKIPVSAPIVVTGEDAFEETSHIERMCMVRLPREGRNPAVLTEIYEAGDGFARTWVEWIVNLVQTDTLPAPPRLNDRPQQARAVARWGYDLLNDFTQRVCGYALPPYDDSLIRAAHDQTASRPILVQALRALEGRMGNQGRIVWRDENRPDALNIRIYDFVHECVSLGIPLAGGPAAVVNELEQRYTTEMRSDPQGEYLHVIGVE